MAAKKRSKVRDLAKNFGVSPEEVLHELQELGVEIDSPTDIVDDELIELIEEHLKEIATEKRRQQKEADAVEKSRREIHVKSPIIVKNLAESLKLKPNEIVSTLMSMNVLANINQAIDQSVAAKLCASMDYKLVVDRREKDEHVKQAGAEDQQTEPAPEEIEYTDKPEDLQPRPPVVTFLGHVDHGKTSLQDKIRQTNVVDGEAGGITQHIGASIVNIKGKQITFVDTPGHEAFTAMRARGANLTDIAILVVAADDGFMPQTIEAMNHARAAGVPVIVAINKIDLPGADPDKVILHMQQNELMSEDWGGDVGTVRVSAITGEGIEKLLERILLEAEMLELNANPKRPGSGVVIEAQLEQGLGATANIIVQNGTLKRGDIVLCGAYSGKVKTMLDINGERIETAGPSTPVKLVGINGVPEAGAKLVACDSEKEAKRIAESRQTKNRQQGLAKPEMNNLEDIFASLKEGEKKQLNIIVKADVRGSIEAILDSIAKFPSDKIVINAIHTGIGAITENDVLLAAASGALIVGFHTRVNPGVNAAAKQEGVEIRLYSIIYELLEDIREALEGRLAPEAREKALGEARIVQIFDVSKGPKVCGCMVESGLVRVGSKARVHRGGELIFNGAVKSLRRFQDDVKEVRQGLECGIRLDNFLDFQENDRIEFYEVEMRQASL